MSVKATLTVNQVQSVSGSVVSLALFGYTMDGVFQFNDNSADGVLSISGIDMNSHRVQQDIEDAAKAKLQTSPYSMTFGSGDIVRVI